MTVSYDNFPFEAVVFDAFGTLVCPVSRQGAYHKVLAGADDFRHARQLALTKDLSLDRLARLLNLPDIRPDLLLELAKELDGMALFDDTTATVMALQTARVKVAICSNLGAAFGPAVRKMLPMVEDFIFSYEVNCFKPDQAIYAITSDRIGVAPAATLFIGDTPKADVDGPRRFGMRAEFLNRTDGDTLETCIDRAIASIQTQ